MGGQSKNVFTYPRTEPGTQGHLDLVEPLRAMPALAASTLKGIHEPEALFRESPESWCIKELVGHLRDFAEVEGKRLYMMSTQTDPVLEPYDQDAFAKEHDYLGRELDQMLLEYRDHRAATVELLISLVNWNWARTGQHLESGRVSIRQMVQQMVEHERGHIEEMARLRAVAEGTA